MLLPSYLACTSTLMQNCHVLHPGHNKAIHVVIYGALGMPPISGKSVVAESCLDKVAIIESYLNKTLPSCVFEWESVEIIFIILFEISFSYSTLLPP